MKTENVHLTYFSATYTTRKVARAVAGRLPGQLAEHDITASAPTADVALGPDGDALVAAVPVYAGRVPVMAADALRRFRGDATPAVALCVYGNRAYDDALLELCDILSGQGFAVIAAGAFVARHSIFTQIAAGRPDEADMAAAAAFGDRCAAMLAATPAPCRLKALAVPGSRPYREPGAIPIYPSGSRKKCDRCNLCVDLCPVHAIQPERPTRSDGNLCMSCGRCVEICPQHTRCFSGVTYKAAERRLTKLCRERREPELFFAEP